MAYRSAVIARGIADAEKAKTGRKIYVAGSMGPTPKSLTLAEDISNPGQRSISFDDMVAIYSE